LNTIKEEQPEKPVKPEYKLEDLVKEQTRWIIPPNSVLTLLVRFFSKVTGNFESNLTFENSFGLRKLVCPVSAKSDFPVLSTIPKNLYWTVKKARPPNPPESYISKAFIQSESIYEFGPLLIGKNPDKKNEKDVMTVNSTTFRLSNQGSFPADLQFALMSSIMENNPEYKKGVFTISEEKLSLAVNDPPKEIRIWALPDTPQKFKDELIIMMKNNPSPVIIPVQCQGAKPSIDII
jgi:hydrocephalus-inducing protein